MLNLKHDIKIQLKNEKEVFRLVRLLIFTFILSALLLGLPDYIWNMTLYRISVYAVPWLVAIPAIINCVERKINIKELIGDRILFQIVVGTLIGTGMAAAWLMVLYMQGNKILVSYVGGVKDYIASCCYYLFVVAPSEEIVYRVGIMGQLECICENNKWLVPFITNVLFALAHLFQHGWDNVVLAFVIGGVYTISFYKWKKCRFVMVSIMHGMFDLMTYMIPVIIFLLKG